MASATEGAAPLGGPAAKAGSPTRSQTILLSAYAARMLLVLAVTAVLGRILDEASFGFYAYVSTLFFVAHVLLDLGTGAIGIRAIAREPARERAVLEGLLGWRRVCGWALAAVVVALALLETDPTRRLVLLGVAVSLPWIVPVGLYAALQVRQRHGGVALVGVANQLLTLLAAMGMAALHLAGPLFAGLVALREVVFARAVRRIGRRSLGYLPRPRLRSLRPHVRAALLLGLATLCHTLYFHADVFLVRLLRGEAELGAYAAAFRPVNSLLALPGLLLAPLVPVLSRTADADRPRFARQVGGAAWLVLGLGALGGVSGFMLAPDLLAALYGARYAAGPLASVDALQWLSVALAAVFTTSAFTTALLSDGRVKALLLLGLGGLTLNVVGNLLLVPRHGFTAAALTTAVTELAVGAGAIVLLLTRAGVRIIRLEHALAMVPALCLGAALHAMHLAALPRVVIGVGLGALGVLALLLSPPARRFRRDIEIGPLVEGGALSSG